MNCDAIIGGLCTLFEQFSMTQNGAGLEPWHERELADKNDPVDTVTFSEATAAMHMHYKPASSMHSRYIGTLTSFPIRDMLATPRYHYLLQNTFLFQPDAIPALAALLLHLDAAGGTINNTAAPSLNEYVTLLFLITWVQADAHYSLPFSTMDGCDGIRGYCIVFDFITSSPANFRLAENAINPQHLLFAEPARLGDMWGARKVLDEGTQLYLKVPMVNYDQTTRALPLQTFLEALFTFHETGKHGLYPFSYAACHLPPAPFLGRHFLSGLTPLAQRRVWTTVLVFQRLDAQNTARIPIELVRIIIALCECIFDAPIYFADSPYNNESDDDTDYDEP